MKGFVSFSEKSNTKATVSKNGMTSNALPQISNYCNNEKPPYQNKNLLFYALYPQTQTYWYSISRWPQQKEKPWLAILLRSENTSLHQDHKNSRDFDNKISFFDKKNSQDIDFQESKAYQFWNQ